MGGTKRGRPATTRRPKKRMRRTMMSRRVRAVPQVTLKRTNAIIAWSVGTASTGDFWRYYAPTTALFNNFAELAAVFDQYKVNGIKLTFYPRWDSVDANPAALTNTTVKFVTVVDPYSTLTPTGVYNFATLNTLMEQSGVRVRNGLRPVSVYWKPKIAIPTNVGGGVTYVDSSRMWLNTTSTAVPFLGFHSFIATNNMSTPSGLVYDIYVTFYATFRNLK